MLGHIFPWESLWYSFYRRMRGPQDQSGHEGVKKNVHPFDTWDRTRAVQPVAKHLAVWATWPIVAWRYNTVNIETMKLLNICCTNSIKEIEHYLQYIDVCKAFYIGETRHSLSDCMNGHRFTTTVLNSDLPVAIHTQSHQILFQDCWSVSTIHKLPDSTPDHIRHQFEIAYQLVLQSRHTPGLNIR